MTTATLAPEEMSAEMTVVPLKRGRWEDGVEGFILPAGTEVKSLNAYARVPYIEVGHAGVDMMRWRLCQQMPGPLAMWVRECFVMSRAQLERMQKSVSQVLLQRLTKKLGWVTQPAEERTFIKEGLAAMQPREPKIEFSQMGDDDLQLLDYDVLWGEITHSFAQSRARLENVDFPRPLSNFLEYRYVATHPTALRKAWQVCAARYAQYLQTSLGVQIKKADGLFDLPEEMK